MLHFDEEKPSIIGDQGSLPVLDDDEITLKLMMLIEGECEGIGSQKAADKYGYTRQRYSQILQAFLRDGALSLKSRKRGPKRNYRRTEEVVRQIIRHRFLDPDASAEVIAQKLCQCGWEISRASVERVISQYGLQKKTPRLSSE
jgi:hypothetical protein